MSLVKIINELAVSNVSDAAKFYEEYFGFTMEASEGYPIIWAQLANGSAALMLEDYGAAKKEMPDFPEKTKSSNLLMLEYDNSGEVANLYEDLAKKGAKFFKDYEETDYGKVEFGVYDLDGNMILVSAAI